LPDANTELRDARRLLNMLVRTCRQTLTYFDGLSVMDKEKVKRTLRDAVRESERFLNAP